MKRKLLTIAIPVYKRYNSLGNLLRQIDEQISKENLTEEVEVLICDNSGTEKQEVEYIAPFLSKNYVRYIDNGENIGAINNVLKIFEESSGKYCLASGDDEELLENRLAYCIRILKNLSGNVGAVIFNEEITDNQLVLGCLEAAEKYFWYSGNLGCFIVNTDAVRDYCSRNKRNTLWPQTELIFNALFNRKMDFCIVKDRVMHSPNHRTNTRYNSYYVLEAGFLSLIKTALNLEDLELLRVSIKNTNSRYHKFLLSMLLQYVFNDTRQDTQKTRIALSECKKTYRPYIFDKHIYFFNLLSKIPKWVYILLLKILHKYTVVERSVKNRDGANLKISDDYT